MGAGRAVLLARRVEPYFLLVYGVVHVLRAAARDSLWTGLMLAIYFGLLADYVARRQKDKMS